MVRDDVLGPLDGAQRRLLARLGVVVDEDVLICPSTITIMQNTLQAMRTAKDVGGGVEQFLLSTAQLKKVDQALLKHLARTTENWTILAIRIGNGSRIGPDVRIQPGVRIGQRCTMGRHAEIQFCATIDDDVRVKRGAFVGADTAIRSWCVLMARATVGPRRLIPVGTVVKADV